MRKILIIGFVALLSVVLASGFVDAKVTGLCSNCHTMHNSQNGSPVASGGPYEYLLNKGATSKTACWGCHAQGLSAIKDSVGTPQVYKSGANGYGGIGLAGGDFAYIVDNSGLKTIVTGTIQTVGHNVKDTGVTESTITGTFPPGDQHTTGITSSALFTCAGQYGCHGDRTKTTEYLAIYGAHHYNDNALKFGSINEANQALTGTGLGEKVGSSYRFLMGVKGGEETNWEGSSPGISVHNEYKGATSMGTSSATAPASATISGLCAECHGFFHGTGTGETGGTATPWKRHPTDIVLDRGAGTEYSGYKHRTLNLKEYSVEAPVARQSIPSAITSTVTPANDIVMCLSCHRVHASPYEDILRWDYRGMDAGTTGTSAGTGCFVCHTTKDGS